VHALFNELLALLKQLASEEHHTGGSISDFIVLSLGNVDQSFSSWVHDVEQRDDSSAII
jgi:hypothetical protein